MYTSYIGKRYLEHLSKTEKEPITSKDYFKFNLYPLFYNNPQYLQSTSNNPFFQLIAQKKAGDPKARKKAFEELMVSISNYSVNNEGVPDIRYGPGFAAADDTGTTSGQISSIQLPMDEEDIYASWIGAGFGIGAAGGLNLLIDNDQVLDAVREGWDVYRKYVDENKEIANKIETWNGLWLVHRFGEHYKSSNPTADFSPVNVGKDKTASMERPTWVSIVFALVRMFPGDNLNVYIYNFGQMNRTIGFVRITLPEVSRLYQLYNSLFAKTVKLSNTELASIYTSQYGLQAVCERFSDIGLRALEPKDLRKYILGEKQFVKSKDDSKNLINYSIYITWVVAMLNNKELLNLAEKAADAFREFEKGGRKGRVTRDNQVKELLGTRNRKDFIQQLTNIVEEDKHFAEICDLLVNAVMMDVSTDNIPLFTTLIGFKYAIPDGK